MSSPTVQLDHHLPFTCDSKDAFFAYEDNKKNLQTTFSKSRKKKYISSS